MDVAQPPNSSPVDGKSEALADSTMPSLEQHFLKNLADYRCLLSRLNIENRLVLELGAGEGDLTRLILEQNPAEIRAYEITPRLCSLENANLKLVEEDFTRTDLGFLNDDRWCVISNPPYSCLPFIEQMINQYRIQDVVLMIPARKLSEFSDYKVAFSLQGGDFSPPSRGEHLIIYKGFDQPKAES